ncbi:DUF1816 domain-containing protein [Pleurocapsales cyanobacterium LEGE 10410]|nr:DUF1816 domain-containing protein [Pleurocapsales cyanobacterium LEGE 10410]
MSKNFLKSNKIENNEPQKMGWWIEIRTANPSCTYYFGDFYSFTAAALAQYGYIQDLSEERAELVAVEIKQCQPKQLTIYENESKHFLDDRIYTTPDPRALFL